MTQDELDDQLQEIDFHSVSPSDARGKILELINQHVTEVIGEDEHPKSVSTDPTSYRPNPLTQAKNDLRAKQRKRAGL